MRAIFMTTLKPNIIIARTESLSSKRWIKGSRIPRISYVMRSGITNAVQTHAAAAGHYRTLEIEHQVLYEVKKSRFVTWAWPVRSAEDALDGIRSRSDPSASHNCWAYRIGSEYRSSDDGEPGGTAGRPILTSIDSEGLDHVCVLVTRYFGGIKLGTGGLARAYGGAARLCLREAAQTEVAVYSELQIKVPFEDLGKAYGVIENFNAKRVREDFSEECQSDAQHNGMVLMLEVPQSKEKQMVEALKNSTGGRIQVI